MAQTNSRSFDVGRHYSRTLVAWALGVLGTPLAAAALVAVEVSTRCQAESVDCSWGPEVLLILPVLFVSVVTVAPWAVYAVLRRAGDPLAGSTALWALLLVVPSIPVVAVTGMGGAILLLPPLVGRALALRRHQATAGAPHEEAAV